MRWNHFDILIECVNSDELVAKEAELDDRDRLVVKPGGTGKQVSHDIMTIKTCEIATYATTTMKRADFDSHCLEYSIGIQCFNCPGMSYLLPSSAIIINPQRTIKDVNIL